MMYTDNLTAQIVLSLLKKYNIRKIVISPGVTNVPIAGSVLSDPFFESYSIVDERSAAYFATGLAFESGEPVAISCTGATASRNYLSGLTEAYYRNLPIIALTSQRTLGERNIKKYADLVPQFTDRSISQNDVKCISVDLPLFEDNKDIYNFDKTVFFVNKALSIAVKRGGGPVHINLRIRSLSFTTAMLPDVTKIDYFQTEDLFNPEINDKIKERLYNKKIAILIGSHKKFSKTEIKAIENFVLTYDAVVFCDHTANYHGINKLLISSTYIRKVSIKPDIIIDIGGVIGDYFVSWLLAGPEFWRISENGEFHQRLGNLLYQFDCPEYIFFNSLSNKQVTENKSSYFKNIKEVVGDLKVPDLPLCNYFISSQLSKKIPQGSSLHLAILHSLRCMNMFHLDESIDCICNVGGFGIDGAISTVVGQSMVEKQKLYFALVGDLAFFYDMNALGIRHIDINLRILLVNNNCGFEFHQNPAIERVFGEKLNNHIAAGGHYGSAKAWAESMGFTYLTANDKESFLLQIDDFCSPDIQKFKRPVIFEVFTTVEDEKKGQYLIYDINNPLIFDEILNCKLVVFGAGSRGIEYANNRAIRDNILYYIDNNMEKQNTGIKTSTVSFNVYPLEEGLKLLTDDIVILIASPIYKQEMYEQLQTLGVKNRIVLTK